MFNIWNNTLQSIGPITMLGLMAHLKVQDFTDLETLWKYVGLR